MRRIRPLATASHRVLHRRGGDESAAAASRYAAAFDREDRDEVGRRAPFLGMFPLRMWWTLRNRHR